MIVTEGSYDYIVTVDGHDIQRTAGPGTIQFISGDERPNIRRISGRAQIVAMHFTSEWLRYTGLDAHELRGRVPVAADNARTLACSMRAEVASGCPSGRLYAESLSIALVTFAYARQPTTSSPGHGPLRGPAKGRVERYMREHLERNLPLTELAALVGLGPRQFTDCFRRTFGTSPHRYLVALRLKEAASLLRCGRREIAEVALSLGFSSQSHFSAAFRKYYGITPRQHMRGVQSNSAQ
jgi:AraC family transcriptional regulator